LLPHSCFSSLTELRCPSERTKNVIQKDLNTSSGTAHGAYNLRSCESGIRQCHRR